MKPCNNSHRGQLQRLLNEGLPEAVESDVADHVAACPACQRELESLAAAQNWWTEASQRLSNNAADVGSLHMGAIDRNAAGQIKPLTDWTSEDEPLRKNAQSLGGSNAPSDLFDDVYATDFAVDFLEPSDDPSVLGRLGEYEIVEVIGRGGMGIVLKGFQKELHRFVAVKVLSPHLSTSGAARRRFAREAQATAAVVNPHVMAIHSVHANSKLPYLVMPFVACESLQQRLDRQGPLDLKDVLRIGTQAAIGLAAAHAQGLVHRDVKPANILLETNVDRVMLTDFGLARAVDDATLTRTGVIAGTPQYMSPEQANGDAVDHRSDLFSLGSVLYSMCTARPPFRAETTFGVLRRIRETDPRPIREINPDIPAWLEQITFTLLAKNPEKRLSTATEVAALMEQCLAHVQQPTTVPLPVTATCARPAIEIRHSISARNLPARSYWALLVVAVVVVMGALMRWPRTQPESGEIRSPTSMGTTNGVEAVGKSIPVTDTLDPTFEWDQTQLELNGVDRTLKQLEMNVLSEMDDEDKSGR